MLPNINLTSNRNFKIRNFEEDKIATLIANKGLRYEGKINGFIKFSGNFYLTNQDGGLIESFEIVILVDNSYPNTFPTVILIDDKVEKCDIFHMNTKGIICFEHTYVCNSIAQNGLRLYDFVNYFLPKYFSWAMVKKYGNSKELQEWLHKEDGIKHFYETLLGTTNKNIIQIFLKNYILAPKISRNYKCFCGSGKKLKYCHINEAQYLNATPNTIIEKDIFLFD